MEKVKPLNPAQLYHKCNPEIFSFKTSDELQDLQEVIGQARAVEAVQFGVGMNKSGYNLFAVGPAGVGKRSTIEAYLAQRAPHQAVPPDWCYINNFQQPQKPRLLRLPAGWGRRLKADVEHLVAELRSLIPSAFEHEDYQARRRAIEDEAKVLHERALEEVRKMAKERHIALIRAPGGFAFAPEHNGEVLDPEAFERLSQQDQEQVEKDVEELQESLQAVIRHIPQLNRETREKLKDLNREVTASAVEHVEQELRETYREFPAVLKFFAEIQHDVVENVEDFVRREERNPLEDLMGGGAPDGDVAGPRAHRRYYVNLLVDNSDTTGAPVIYEDNPIYQNLIGRIEHMAQLGALVTDFNMIKAGALHRANGGYLILDARKLLTQPFAWEELKRVLQSREIRIESVGQMLSLVSTVSLEPEPVPADLKVILVGEPFLYYLLYQHDPDFSELFKVVADFTTDMDRNPENDQLYARLIGTLIRREKLRPFGADAIARVIEYGARAVGDAEKISTSMRQITDLLLEADYWSGHNGNHTVTAADVEKALAARIYRCDRIRERLKEETLRGTLLIDSTGTAVGQVNALSVVSMGGFAFGRPVRITARVWQGDGQVIDIEREVDLAGPIHSKGVLILTGFLGERYATEHPLALTATLVFEQSYGEIEGDSASSTELYALLSALAEVPANQSLAVTGSVDQHGRVQAIGGVNEKVEGFFDLCRARGLSGEQGVLIPAANVKHLMLRQDVVEAVRDCKFSIYPVSTIDQGIELLTGLPAGEKDADGNFSSGSINELVAVKLRSYAEAARRRSRHRAPEGAGGGTRRI